MKNDYQIQEIVAQSTSMVVYLVMGKEGQTYALTRLVLGDRAARNLSSEQFETALAQLKGVQHPCLRGVVDGGLDEVDRQPWIVSQWWDGESLEDRLADQSFSETDLNRLHGLAQILLEKVAPYSGSVCFQLNQIVRTKAADGSSIETFTWDFSHWFKSWSLGASPETPADSQGELAHLVSIIQGPTVSRPVLPAVIEQPTVAPLASAQSGGSGGKLLLIGCGLAALIIGGFFFVKNKKPAEPELALVKDTEQEEVVEESLVQRPQEAHKAEPPKPKPEEPAQVSEKKEEVAKTPPQEVEAPEPEIAERPSLGDMEEVEASDESALAENVGKWVILQGRVKVVSDQGEWIFEAGEDMEEPLKARVENGEPDEEVKGRLVSVVGMLKTAQFLTIEKSDDIEVLEEIVEKKVEYTVADEEEIKTLEGETITLRGKVLSATASGKGNTLYLNFTKKRPFLAAGIRVKKAESGLDLDFLKKFVGHEVAVTGVAAMEHGRHRFLISITSKDQIAK